MKTNTQTNNIPISKLRLAANEELAELLGKLRFSDHFPAMDSGDYWQVFARPWPPTEAGACDVQVSIKPLSNAAGRAAGRGIALGRENQRWLAPALTDEFGSVYFPGLPAGEFRVLLAEDRAGQSSAGRDAAVLEDEGSWLQFDLPGGDTFALLEEVVAGQSCRLAVRSRSAVAVNFVLGPRSGSVILNPGSGEWRSAAIEVPGKLAELAAGQQMFEIHRG